MKNINKLILSSLLIATQLIYTSQEATQDFFRNAYDERVLMRIFHNPDSTLSHLMITVVSPGAISHSFYRNGRNDAIYTNNNGARVTVPSDLSNRVVPLEQYYLMEQYRPRINNTPQDSSPMDIDSDPEDSMEQ